MELEMETDFVELARCAQRELRRRKTDYPQLIATGEMSRTEAERELAAQELIVKHLETEANQMRFDF